MKKLMMVMAAMLPLVLVAQEVNVKWGPEFKKEGGMFGYQYLAGSTAKNYYVVSQPRKANALLKFDLKHNLVSEKELEFMLGKDELDLLGFVQTKSYYYAYLSNDDKKNKKRETYMQQVDDNGNFVGTLKLVTTASYKNRNAIWAGELLFGRGLDDDANGIYKSPDKSLLLSITSTGLMESAGKDKFSITVFDESLKVKWKKEQEFPYEDNKVDLEMVGLSNNGSVVFTAKVYSTEGDKKQKSVGYKYKAFIVTQNDFKEVDLDLGSDKLPVDAGIFFENEGVATIGGFYTDRANKKDRPNGAFGLRIDCGSGKITASQAKPFSSEILEEASTQKDIEKGKGLSSFEITDFVTLANGNMVMVGNRYYTTEISTYNGKTWTYRTVYHSNEKMLIGFDKDMNIRYDKLIDNSCSSFSYYVAPIAVYPVQDNHLLLLYNKGIDATDYFHAAIVDGDGNVVEERNVEFDAKGNFYFGANNTCQVAPDKIIVGALSLKKYKYGTLEVKTTPVK